MTVTERLRQLLDERGVEWWEDAFSSEHRTVFDGNVDVRYCVYQLGSLLFISSILSVTPEQAIEATLGSRDELDEETMTVLHGRLNAAMLALERANEDAEARINAVSDAHEVLTSAEEMRRGTCRNVSDFPKYEFVCSACGGKLDLVDEFDNPTMQHDDGSIGPRFCPNCGRMVVE